MTDELRTWIADDLVSAREKLANGVLALIPPELRADEVDGGGIPPVYVLWHLARHHDVATNSVLRDREQVVHSFTDDVGIDDGLWRGLAEGADLDLVRRLDPDRVGTYALACLDETIDWIRSGAALDDLDSRPAATEALRQMGTPEDDFDWLYRMWDGKPRRWFLSWSAIGHVVTHTGELVSLRNRLGLSPF